MGQAGAGATLGDSGLRFNLAHAGDVVVYAFADHREVGVDVESSRHFSAADDVADPIFSRRERMDYRALPAMDRPRGFLNCWTRKEAFTKAVGKRAVNRLLRWPHVLARHAEEYCGPTACDGFSMLLEPHAAAFAELFRSIRAT